MRKVQHSRIINLHEVHETKDSIYLIMDQIDGQPLRSILQRPAYRKNSAILKIMQDLLEVLDHFASQGIVHRGLNLTNIILEKEGNIKLIDLITVMDINSSERTKENIGTPGFIAPEIFVSNKAISIPWSHKCDVFSAGCIFFYL